MALNCFSSYFKVSRSNSKYIVKSNPSCLKDQSPQESTNPNLQKYNCPWAPGAILKMLFPFFFPFLFPQPSFRFSWNQLIARDDAPACRVISYKDKISTELYNFWAGFGFIYFKNSWEIYFAVKSVLSYGLTLNAEQGLNMSAPDLSHGETLGRTCRNIFLEQPVLVKYWYMSMQWKLRQHMVAVQKSWDRGCWGKEEILSQDCPDLCSIFIMLELETFNHTSGVVAGSIQLI